MLGDGHIYRGSGDRFRYPNVNCRLGFTFSVENLPYLRYFKFVLYAPICTKAEAPPRANPKLTGKPTSQSLFLFSNSSNLLLSFLLLLFLMLIRCSAIVFFIYYINKQFINLIKTRLRNGGVKKNNKFQTLYITLFTKV